ncbi:MAG: response regulator [Lachnospiraceae bacterium]|nr:response regulator [Lachnospiraceae bacterium]
MATVLIVDDSKTSRKILGDVIRNMGLEVIGEAVNGEDGFIKYKELRPDIVTMDITMPVMSGLESLLLIKHEDENAKVVMITAAGQKNNLMAAVKAGAEEFLTKPLDEAEIRRVIGDIAAKLDNK